MRITTTQYNNSPACRGFFFEAFMKRFLIWGGILAALLGPANAAGTIPGFSLTPQFDAQGKVTPGCKLYVIAAGTTQTPQNSYQDTALTIPQPNPLTCDATGRLPQWFVADGLIKVRLTNASGVQLFVGDNLLVVGPSSGGGGGGGTVDPTTIMSTGDIKDRYGTGVLTGFVRLNGRSIGSATSGATERANSDVQALFEYLWNNDSTLVVPTGRGASSNADWVANKTIALPDQRGRTRAGANDMGNTNASVLNPLAVTKGDTVTLGSLMGYGASRSLLAANLPAHTHTVVGQTGDDTPDHTHTTYGPSGGIWPGGGGGGIGFGAQTSGASVRHIHPINIVSGNGPGSSTAFDTITPLMIITSYMKL